MSNRTSMTVLQRNGKVTQIESSCLYVNLSDCENLMSGDELGYKEFQEALHVLDFDGVVVLSDDYTCNVYHKTRKKPKVFFDDDDLRDWISLLQEPIKARIKILEDGNDLILKVGDEKNGVKEHLLDF